MKIINIASSDDFEDILEAVRESKSNELILVVPKSNRLFKSKNKAEKLRIEFERLGKDVSIISPEQKESVKGKKERDIASFYLSPEDEKKPEAKEKKPEQTKKFILILIGSAFALFIFLVFVSLGEADVRIIPRKNDFSVNISAAVSDKITEIDEVYGIIPGEWIEIEKVVSRTFSSSAEKDVFQKARGTVTIYNNFSVLPQVLVATTRFQTAEGLVFRVPNAVTVPGMTKAGNNALAGQVEVEVVADRAGGEYNIEPSDFRIPGFLGSPKYQGFYAKSFEKFSGGFVGRSYFVSRSDLEKSEEALRNEAAEEVKAGLGALGNFKILDKAVKIGMEKTADSGKAGDLAKEFMVALKIRAATLAFKEEDAAELVSRYVKNSQNEPVLRNGLKMDFVGPELDEEERELSFRIVSSGKTVQNIDKDRIILEIAGKKKDEAGFYLRGVAEIESARILSPFWLRKIPKNKSRINIKVLVE